MKIKEIVESTRKSTVKPKLVGKFYYSVDAAGREIAKEIGIKYQNGRWYLAKYDTSGAPFTKNKSIADRNFGRGEWEPVKGQMNESKVAELHDAITRAIEDKLQEYSAGDDIDTIVDEVLDELQLPSDYADAVASMVQAINSDAAALVNETEGIATVAGTTVTVKDPQTGTAITVDQAKNPNAVTRNPQTGSLEMKAMGKTTPGIASTSNSAPTTSTPTANASNSSAGNTQNKPVEIKPGEKIKIAESQELARIRLLSGL